MAGTIISALGSIASSIAMTVGASIQQQQAEANAEAQEAQMQYNKRLEEREAARVEAEGQENARRQREIAEHVKAQQRALLGKSGAAMTSGSPLAILGQTAADQEMMVQDAHSRNAIEADKHREQAKMFGYQAGVARMSAPSRGILASNIIGAWGSGVTNFGNSLTTYLGQDSKSNGNGNAQGKK